MNIQQSLNAGSGTSTSALSFGGYDGTSPGNTADTELWERGISIGAWSTSNNLNTAKINYVKNIIKNKNQQDDYSIKYINNQGYNSCSINISDYE